MICLSTGAKAAAILAATCSLAVLVYTFVLLRRYIHARRTPQPRQLGPARIARRIFISAILCVVTAAFAFGVGFIEYTRANLLPAFLFWLIVMVLLLCMVVLAQAELRHVLRDAREQRRDSHGAAKDERQEREKGG